MEVLRWVCGEEGNLSEVGVGVGMVVLFILKNLQRPFIQNSLDLTLSHFWITILRFSSLFFLFQKKMIQKLCFIDPNIDLSSSTSAS
jgi:hypothetical protein